MKKHLKNFVESFKIWSIKLAMVAVTWPEAVSFLFVALIMYSLNCWLLGGLLMAIATAIIVIEDRG